LNEGVRKKFKKRARNHLYLKEGRLIAAAKEKKNQQRFWPEKKFRRKKKDKNFTSRRQSHPS